MDAHLRHAPQFSRERNTDASTADGTRSTLHLIGLRSPLAHANKARLRLPAKRF